jgi:hypothetical protein
MGMTFSPNAQFAEKLALSRQDDGTIDLRRTGAMNTVVEKPTDAAVIDRAKNAKTKVADVMDR